MARPLRIEYPGATYHVTSRGNERKAIFRGDLDRRKFLELLSSSVEQFILQLHAYVFMDNHYHLLVETPEGGLSRAVRYLNGVYTQYFNRRHRRVGHLFQGRYKAILIDKDSYLAELSRYIHLNPWRVRSGVKDPLRYRWSSLRAYDREGEGTVMASDRRDSGVLWEKAKQSAEGLRGVCQGGDTQRGKDALARCKLAESIRAEGFCGRDRG
ncbi:MAG: transposase, partial [Deltaproteobacteria bacterium]|nr:transposase [Deltaproteobacteria bacterium]